MRPLNDIPRLTGKSDVSGHTDPLESEDEVTLGMVVRPSKHATRRVFPPQGMRKTNL